MIVDTLVTSHLMAVCSKFLLQRRATLGRLADVDCRVLQPASPSRATAGPGETFPRGPQTFSRGPSGKNFVFFSKWYILAYFMFLADGEAPKRAKRRGARGS